MCSGSIILDKGVIENKNQPKESRFNWGLGSRRAGEAGRAIQSISYLRRNRILTFYRLQKEEEILYQNLVVLYLRPLIHELFLIPIFPPLPGQPITNKLNVVSI